MTTSAAVQLLIALLSLLQIKITAGYSTSNYWSNILFGTNNKNNKNDQFVSLEFVGVGYHDVIPSSSNSNSKNGSNDNSKDNNKINTLFLAPVGSHKYYRNSDVRKSNMSQVQVFDAIPVPISDGSLLLYDAVIRSAYARKKMSKVRCLALNKNFVNRDDGLFDNIPWKEWSVGYAKDAAGNVIDERFRLAKRDAFDRFNGKDWPGRSFSIGNLAARVMYELNLDENAGLLNASFDDNAVQSLALRVLEVELREARTLLAEVEADLALMLSSSSGESSVSRKISDLKIEAEERRSAVKQIEQTIISLSSKSTSSQQNVFMKNLLQAMIDSTFEGGNGTDEKRPPYRGAYGFAPYIDSRADMFSNSIMPYSGPLDLLCEMIENQLRADVTGVFIENTWLLSDDLVLGGACVLERRATYEEKSIEIEGERLSLTTEVDDKEADLVQAGEKFIVECDAEEAIGLALHIGSSILMERDIWESAKIRVSYNDACENTSTDVTEPLRIIIFKSNIEKNHSFPEATSIMLPTFPDIRVNFKTTNGFFESESDFGNKGNTIPIQTLSEFDSLTIQDKAKILLSLPSFKGKLPRPRKVRQQQQSIDYKFREPLDDLLLPLIDESVRHQYMRRMAIQSGDFDRANELQDKRSRRQQAKELAEAAYREGNGVLGDLWNSEADFYGNIRADVTQDEGTYSSFLDKDEWYERDRVKRASKLKKSNFGSLFDGL